MGYEERVLAACKASDRVYVLNPNFRRANFYSQQIRVLALIKALSESGVIRRRETEVAVVGAGVAGLTAAAASRTVGARVTLIDKNSTLMSRYSEALHRELHPNIVSWPFQPLRAITDLPFLNWACGQAPSVTKTILEDWTNYFSDEVAPRAGTAKSVLDDDDKDMALVTLENDERIWSDIAIVATGFLDETGVGGFSGPQYWTPRSFDGTDQIVVSGCGDGGLIDSAAQVFGVKAIQAARELAYVLEDELQETIREVEADALEMHNKGSQAEAEARLQRFYSKLTVRKRDLDCLHRFKKQSPAAVQLVHAERHPFRPTAAPINKVLVSILANGPSPLVKFKNGTLAKSVGTLSIESDGASDPIDMNRILIRHGAAHSAWDLLTPEAQAKLNAANPETLNEVPPDDCFRHFYEHATGPKFAPSPHHLKDKYVARLTGLLQSLIHHACPSGPSVSVRRDATGSGEWAVELDRAHHDAVRGLFPITFGRVRISLTEAVDSVAF